MLPDRAPSSFAATLERALGLAAFAPLREVARSFAGEPAWPAVEMYTERLAPSRRPTSPRGEAIAFVAAEAPPSRRKDRSERPIGTLYDGRIVLERTVPTRRENWHDFLNFLVWATYPRAKHALHERQWQAHRERLPDTFRSQPGARTREQDALALLDEGGLLLLVDAAHAGQARAALDESRHDALEGLVAAGSLAPLLYGHAVYEHLAVGPSTVVRAAPTLLVAQSLPTSTAERCRLADEGLAALLAAPTSFRAPSNVRAMAVVDALFAR